MIKKELKIQLPENLEEKHSTKLKLSVEMKATFIPTNYPCPIISKKCSYKLFAAFIDVK